MPENIELCTKCGGRCCKRMSGMYSPSDFEIVSVESIMNILNTEKCSIDWWEGDLRPNIPKKERLSQIYYIRPRHVDAPIIDPSWSGTCIFLSSTGCELSYEDRPSNCRGLVPHIDNSKCYNNNSKEERVAEWIPYQDILVECHLNVY